MLSFEKAGKFSAYVVCEKQNLLERSPTSPKAVLAFRVSASGNIVTASITSRCCESIPRPSETGCHDPCR